MPERTVQQVLASYTDADGVLRYALQGETVSVHPDDLARFAEANGIIEVTTPTKKAAPKKAPRKT